MSNKADKLEDMHDVEENLMDHPKILDSLKNDAETHLYVSCSKFTRLYVVLRLYNLKAENGLNNQNFTTILQLLKDMLSKDNELSDRTHEAKKILYSMSMDYERIHDFPSDCILYGNEYKSLEKCPVCGRPRNKTNNKSSAKVCYGILR